MDHDQFKTKLLLLHHWKGMSWTGIFAILKSDPTLSSLKDFTINELKSKMNLPIRCLPNKDLPTEPTLNLMKNYQQNNIFPITIFDEYYPQLLKEIYQPPWVIYVKGNLELLQSSKKLAVVGSRQPTPYGQMVIQVLFPELIKKGVIIVSGLARGIDAHSHEMAIKHGGSTIGVIAGGFYHIYPKENIELANKMGRHHLLISEYPPDSKPERWQFPMRNRIISGLSYGTLIVEAQRKSGSLITANYALNEGREVFAVPGSILSPHSMGTNDLIGQGAKLVKTAVDILEEFFWE